MRKRYLVSAVYLVALHVLAVALVAKVEAVPKIVTKVSMARVLSDFGDRMKARRFSHPVIFIGDSHTQTIGALPNALNFGATGSTTTGAQIVVKRNAKKLAEASAVMLMIGTNDVWRHKLAGLDDRLAAIEQDIPRDVTLIWSGIPPANDVRIEPADIARANVTIQKLCASNPRCTYVDTWALLGDSDGMPDPRYFLPDGVHFAPRGYERWLGTLLDTLEYQP